MDKLFFSVHKKNMNNYIYVYYKHDFLFLIFQDLPQVNGVSVAVTNGDGGHDESN